MNQDHDFIYGHGFQDLDKNAMQKCANKALELTGVPA